MRETSSAHRHLRRDCREQRSILGGVRLVGLLGAEREDAGQRRLGRVAGQQRHQQGDVRPRPARRGPRPAAAPVLERSSSRTTSKGSRDQRSSVEHPAAGRQRRHPGRAGADGLELAGRHLGQHRHRFGMQGRVDMVDDQRHQLARIGLERHASGQRHQQLAGVVLRAEEPAVEPPLGALTVVAGDDQQRDTDGIEDWPSGDDFGERQVPLAHQREHERHRGQGGQHGQRALGERVLQAPAQHRARAEHAASPPPSRAMPNAGSSIAAVSTTVTAHGRTTGRSRINVPPAAGSPRSPTPARRARRYRRTTMMRRRSFASGLRR